MIVTILVEFPVVAALAHMASFTRSNLQIVAGEIPNDLSMLKATFFLSGQICFRWGSIPTFGILAKSKLFVGLIAIVRMN
jgi:hypothetical protein